MLPVHAAAEQQQPDPVVVDVPEAVADPLDPFHQTVDGYLERSGSAWR